MEAPKVKWFKTTGGKVGIVLGSIAAVIGTVLLVKHFRKPKDQSTTTTTSDSSKQITDQPKNDQVAAANNTSTTTAPVNNNTSAPAGDLPNGGVGCGPIRTAFDRIYNYIKCGN